MKKDCPHRESGGIKESQKNLAFLAKTIAWIILVGGISLSVAVWRRIDAETEQRARNIFDRSVTRVVAALQGRLQLSEMLLHSGSAFLRGSAEVTQTEWETFVREVRSGSVRSWVPALAYSPYLTPEKLEQHIQQVRAAGFPAYDVRPAGTRDAYAPVTFLEPLNEKTSAGFGFDILSHPTRREGAERAMVTGETAATGGVILSIDESRASRPTAFLLLHAVGGSTNAENPAEHPDAPAGFMICPIHIDDFMSIASIHLAPGLGVELFDEPGAGVSADEPLFRLGHGGASANPSEHPLFTTQTRLAFGGHEWTLRFQTTDEFETLLNNFAGPVVLIGGTSISFLLFGLLRVMASSRDRALELTAEMTQALDRAHSRLQSIVSNDPECVMVLTPEGNITEINPAGLALLQLKQHQEASGRNILDWIHPEDRAAFRVLLRRVLDGEKHSLSFRAVGSAGQMRWVETHAVPLREQTATISSLLTVTRDITTRREAEEQLRESETSLRLAQRVGQIGSWELHLQNQTLKWSEETYRIFGCDPVSFRPTRESFFGFVHPEDREQVRRASATAATSDRRYTIEHRIVRPDGSERFVEEQAEVILNATATPIRMIGVVRDITARKRAEQTKAALEAQLRQAQKMEAIGTLAGGIAHDFNNILAAILGYASLLRTEIEGNASAEDSLGEIVHAGHRARDLTKQILTFCRRDESSRRPLLLQPIIEDALRLVRATLPSTIELRSRLEAPTARVFADPTQMHQVLLNLATNAADAMRDSGGVFEVRLSTVTIPSEVEGQPWKDGALKPGTYVLVSATDSGQGMDKDTLRRIFEPFFTTKEPGRGTGLGLSVVHGILEEHGGVVEVDSERGKGTRFDIYLPHLVHDELNAATPATICPSRGDGQHILWVDDELPLVAAGKRILEAFGYRVTATGSSLEALAIIRAAPHDFSAIITDQTMPGLTGSALAARIMEFKPDLPIILVTGYAGDINLTARPSPGIREILLKPVGPEVLAATLHRVIGSARTEKQPLTTVETQAPFNCSS